MPCKESTFIAVSSNPTFHKHLSFFFLRILHIFSYLLFLINEDGKTISLQALQAAKIEEVACLEKIIVTAYRTHDGEISKLLKFMAGK